MNLKPKMVIAFCLLAAMNAGAGIIGIGRDLPEGRDTVLSFSAGAVMKMEALVEETTRQLYDVTGETWKQLDAESYDESDFNMSGPYPAFGLEFHSIGWLFSFNLDALVFDASTDSIAMRNYYIGVGDDVYFNGAAYEHMKIPVGSPFSADLFGGSIELGIAFHPLSINPAPGISIVPSLEAGILAFAGQYDIDAGDPVGTTVYQNPPIDFVVGGKSSGLAAIGIPQFGPGCEIRIGEPERANLVLSASYLFFNYDGSSEYITTADHRDKDAEIDHENLCASLRIEHLLADGNTFTWGVQARLIRSEGMTSASATSEEEILAERERFDKVFAFELSTLTAMIGMTF